MPDEPEERPTREEETVEFSRPPEPGQADRTDQLHPADPGETARTDGVDPEATEQLAPRPAPWRIQAQDEEAEQEAVSRRRLRRGGLIAAAVLAVLAVLYGVDLVTSQGEVPRGVTVAGVDIGGMQPVAAEQKLREQIGPRLNRPITVRAGEVTTTLDPETAGLSINWAATVEQAGEQPLNPWTRLMSLFTTREVGVMTEADRSALTAAVRALRPQINQPPREGDIRFAGTDPVAVEPKPGQRLLVPGAVEAVLANWASGQPVELPVETIPVSVTSDEVHETIEEVAEPAVSGPVTVTGDGNAEAVLQPSVIADTLRFKPNGDGGLDASIDTNAVIDVLAPQLADTETEVRDAEVVVRGDELTVVPSRKGHTIDWKKSLADLMSVLTSTDDRTIPAVYVAKLPEFTTKEAKSLETSAVISSFTTGGFAPDSGVNIRLVAQEVDGAVVAPGETFSLNGYTGPRTKAQGYIEAGIIKNGRPATGVGGGISQFATTLFNAAYFAGMTLIEHHEHSYYISRYPEGREATVFAGVLDLVFRNDSPTPVVIQTNWTPESITVKFLGTKHYEVESITSGRSNFTEPGTIRISEGPCIPTDGQQGFTVSNTRIVRDAQTGEVVKRTGHTTVYEPLPEVICTGSSD